MWVQFDENQINDMLQIAVNANRLDIAAKIEHFIKLEARHHATLSRHRTRAKLLYETEGELEFDEDAVVSRVDGNGAYVMGWQWIPSGRNKEKFRPKDNGSLAQSSIT